MWGRTFSQIKCVGRLYLSWSYSFVITFCYCFLFFSLHNFDILLNLYFPFNSYSFSFPRLDLMYKMEYILRSRSWFLTHFLHFMWCLHPSVYINSILRALKLFFPLRAILFLFLFHYLKICVLTVVTSYFTIKTVVCPFVFNMFSSLFNIFMF